MIFNLWMGYNDRASSSAKTPDEHGQFGAGYDALGDVSVIDLFRIDDAPGPRTYELWSMYAEVEDEQGAVDVRNDLKAIYPGQLRTIGGWWYEDGAMVGTENVYSTRTVEKTWSVLNPDYQPDPEEPDFDDRYVLRVTGDVEEEYVSGHTGDPLFPLHTRILEFMPDLVDEEGAPIGRPSDLSDVNLGMGQVPRNFL